MVSYELFLLDRVAIRRFPSTCETNDPRHSSDPLTAAAGQYVFCSIDVKYEGSELAVHSISTRLPHACCLARSNALAVLPDGEGCQPGDPVDLLLLH